MHLLLLIACSSSSTPTVRKQKVERQKRVPDLKAPPLPPASKLAEKQDVEGLPDVVLVSIDTLRPDHLSSYGHDRPTSPFIDSLASQGVRFEHARSPSPWTLPAHTTMFTGQLPTTHYVVEDGLRLADTEPVLPDLLRARGYATGAAVGTLFVSRMYGFHRGFVHFEDFGIHGKKVNLQGQTDTKAIVDDLASYVQSAPADRPLFLFLHTYDAHYEYDPPEPYASMFDRAPEPTDPAYRSYNHYKKHPLTKEQLDHQIAQYDESIRYIDDQLKRLDGVLKKAGRNVRWVITADHGEEFGERGSWGHGHTLYAEQLRIPLIVSGPGVPKGKVVAEPVGTQDIAVTLASWAGVADQLRRPDGIDLTPYLSGEKKLPQRPFLAETSRHRSMLVGLYEHGKRLDWDVASGDRQVFSDATETAAPEPDQDGQMRGRALELLGQPWTATGAGTVEAGRRGRVLTRFARRAQRVKAGESFHVFPLDTPVRFRQGKSRTQPMAAAGKRPVLPPLRWEGGARAVPVDLSQDDKEALKALGYVQDD